ncbi:MAG: FMN-binding protein [Verrucomicrobiaceae bacterium]|nr:FMN-binding protein [Verrucomicrobiaceae bacterium]
MSHPAHPTAWRSRLLRMWRLGMLVASVLVLQRAQEKGAAAGAREIDVTRVRDFFPEAQTIGKRDATSGMQEVKDASGVSLGFIAQTAPESDDIVGYSGPTNTLIALDRNRRIAGLRVLRSGDTSDHLAEVVRERKFFDQFKNKNVAEVAGLKVDAVSGATLTSSAIAEGVLRRLGKSAEASLRFPEAITLDEVRKLEPKAASLRAKGTRMEVLDEGGALIAIATRTAPTSDGVVGYKGPSDTLMLLEPDGVTLRKIALRKSYDTEDYVGDVTGDAAYLKTFDGMSVRQIAEMDFAKAGVEGVSGATQTSWGVAEGVRMRAQAMLKEDVARVPWFTRIRWRWQDAGHLIVILSAITMAFTRLRGMAWCRHAHHALLVVYAGFISGEMLSQGLLAGWAGHSAPWRSAAGLVAMTAVALLGPVLTGKHLYCHHICPHGALQQLLAKRLRWQWSPSKRLDGMLSAVPFVLLSFVFLAAVFGLGVDLNALEPFDAYLFRIAGTASLVIAVAGLLGALFTPLAYCRYGCPTGALFKMLRFTGGADHFGLRDWLAAVALGAGWLMC